MCALLARQLGTPKGMLHALSFHSRRFAAPSVQLYQYEICPFCCKVKAFLDWQKVPYSTVEVNPISKAEIKQFKPYKKVPVAMIDGNQVLDSQKILTTVASALDAKIADTLEDPEVLEWLSFADKELAVLLFPNITRSFSESFEAFGYISDVPTFSAGSKAANRLAGSVAMWLANGKLKKKYNITDERKQLIDTVNRWTSAIGDGPFLKGSTPTVADVAIFGVISSIRGMAAYNELMESSADLRTWNDHMRAALGGSMRIEEEPVTRRYGPTAV
jgi:microsomal prostaglandin-E synthase 2